MGVIGLHYVNKSGMVVALFFISLLHLNDTLDFID